MRQLLRLAIPLAAQQVGFQTMGMVDAMLLGRYSKAALAGAGVGNSLLFGISCVGLGIVMGMDTVVPQALGGGRTEDARRSVGAGVRIAILVGLIGTLLVFASPLVLEAVHVDPEVVHEARAYLYVRALGVAPMLITVAFRSYLVAHHVTRPLVIAMIAGNALNAALDLVLIFGVSSLGIPALGVIGAGTATTIVQLLTIWVYFAGLRSVDGDASRPPSTRADMLAILRYGLPVGGQLLAEVGIFGVATVLAAKLGETPAAAHSIALQISSLTFSFCVGIASATSVRVGHEIGAGDVGLARERGLEGVKLGLGVMGCFALVFVAAPRLLASGFSGDATVLDATVPLMQIAALFQLSDGTQAIAAGALRGLGHTHATLVANLIGHYAVGLPISLWLAFGAHLGAPGLWWGLSAGLTATAVILVARFFTGTRSTSGSPRGSAA